jgi:hypothetical protein
MIFMRNEKCFQNGLPAQAWRDAPIRLRERHALA